MYSVNGRLKKENAGKTKKTLVCSDCGFILENFAKEFGEENCCPKCQSKNLVYKIG